MFYERGSQEKSFPLTRQPDFFLTASPAILDEPDVMGRRSSLSIELLRTTARLIPPLLPINVASMVTMVLLVTRSLWQFQVVRGGLLLSQDLYRPKTLVETLPRPVIR
jgi:hypothetical protein